MTDASARLRAFVNYIWLIRGDSPDWAFQVATLPVLDALAKQRLTPAAILTALTITATTRRRRAGFGALRRAGVGGPAQEHIPTLTQRLHGGDRTSMPGLEFDARCSDIPPAISLTMVGFLFAAIHYFPPVAGRLYSKAPDNGRSLMRLAALPPETAVYSGHEYTAANLRFAITVEPDNADSRRHQEQVHELRARNEPTLPSTIELEKRINPFLRTASLPYAEKLPGRPDNNPLPRLKPSPFTPLEGWIRVMKIVDETVGYI